MELMLNNLMSLKNHLSKLVNCLLFTGLMVVSKKSSNKTWTKKTIAATLSVYMVAGMMTGLPGIGINSAYAAVNTNWVDITGTACLSSPFGITVDSAGNRYIAINDQIRSHLIPDANK
jgi:phosphotransferase system  glucose/maltose/N-acetylglucosamine-specific IIC component